VSAPASERRGWVDHTHPGLSISRQCALLGVSRSSVYYTPNRSESEENLALMRLIDEEYLRHPFYGVPRITHWLNSRGLEVNHKRVARLMRVMGLQATLPGPHTSKPHPEHTIYPYLLRDLAITEPDAVWCADITYIPMWRGFMYLVAVMDWYSRYVLTWELSNTLEAGFCTHALERALERDHAKCQICDVSPLGLVEMTRARTGKTIESISFGSCPYCDGRGRVKIV